MSLLFTLICLNCSKRVCYNTEVSLTIVKCLSEGGYNKMRLDFQNVLDLSYIVDEKEPV